MQREPTTPRRGSDRVPKKNDALTPKRLVDKDQAYFWSREWQQAEREAEEDIRAGRVKEFASAEELIEDLEG